MARYELSPCLTRKTNIISIQESKVHRIDNLQVRDIAVTKDSKWVLCVGRSQDDNGQPNSQKQKHEIICEFALSICILTDLTDTWCSIQLCEI